MFSQLTTTMLDCVAQADGIYNRPVFFVNDAGEGMSIKMMHEHNADAVARQMSDSTDVVYLMYALITCQAWLQVSTCAGHDAQLQSNMSARHVYMYLRQQYIHTYI